MVQVVGYVAGDGGTEVQFEIETPNGYRAVGARDAAVRVRDAVRPAISAARDVLQQLSELSPDEVEVTFGIKVSGGADWLVAKAASEANFAVKLRWSAGRAAAPAIATESGAEEGSDLAEESVPEQPAV
jgi:hypothetical protein